MDVNLAVCGKFHYHHYVRYLDQAGVLGRFYYAARISTNAADLGIPDGRAFNAWMKEYLVHGHARLLGTWAADRCYRFYHGLWQSAVLRHWRPASLLHFMMHGNCDRLIARARSEGAHILGEPVNCHPDFLLN